MQPGLLSANVLHLPCYLETQDEKNMHFYKNKALSWSEAHSSQTLIRAFGFLAGTSPVRGLNQQDGFSSQGGGSK